MLQSGVDPSPWSRQGTRPSIPRQPPPGSKRRSRCSVCGLDQRQSYLSINSHAQSKHGGKRPLLRTYSLTSPKELSRFLEFIAEEVKPMVNHPHYDELRQAAKLDRIPWKSGAGEWMEKIIHFVIDAHVQPCTDKTCGLTYIRVNNSTRWNAFTASSCRQCQLRDKEGAHMWEVDTTHPSGPFVGNLSAACISLLIAPMEAWEPETRAPWPRGSRCQACDVFRPHRNSTFWGGPAFYLLGLCMRMDFCLCRVKSDGQVITFPWTR